MTPERAEGILRSVVASLQIWIEELEVAESIRPVPAPAIQHVILSMKQARLSLHQLMDRS